MDDLKTIIHSLGKSNYLPEWILQLKDNEVLFSPKRNIKACIKIEDNRVRSDVWDGLRLLGFYCSGGFDNKEVDDFVVSLINESIDLYERDANTDPYLKLNSSNAVLQEMLDIILSKPVFVNKIRFKSFVEIYLDGVLSWPFSLAHKMFEHLEALLESDQNTVFEVYKTLLEHETKKDHFEKYLVVRKLIEKAPYKYYEYSKSKIIGIVSKEPIFNMGSFYECSQAFTHEDYLTIFEWLKISSERIDAQLLEKDILRFIESDNELLNKIGLCLINLNFDNVGHLFLGRLGLFFSNKNFYADLRCLLEARSKDIFVPDNKERLIKALEGATFGLEDGSSLNALKNHLAIIFSANSFDVPHQEEDSATEEFVLNFNKGVYMVKSRTEEDIERIKKTIWNKSVEEVAEKYAQLSNSSYYFGDVLFKAVSQYLFAFHPNDYFAYLGLFDEKFVTSLIYHCADEKNEISVESLTKTIVSAIALMEKDRQYLKCMSAALYATKKLLNSQQKEEVGPILKSIKTEWIDISEYDSYEDIITTCINEDLFEYFDLLTLTFLPKAETAIVENVVGYYKGNWDYKKLKSILACFFPRLFVADKEYALSMIDYVFNNFEGKLNLSYPLLAISNGYSEPLLSLLGKRGDLMQYLSFNDNKSRDEMAHSIISEWFFGSYIFHGTHYDVVKIQFDRLQFSIVLSCIRLMNYWIKNRELAPDQLKRFERYLEDFYIVESKDSLDYSEIDQLIRNAAELIMISDDFSNVAWRLLLDLFRGFRHFFSDECIKLVDTYKNTKYEEIVKLLDMYFASYQPYVSYEETMIQTYNLVCGEARYKEKARTWRASLVSKNIDLKGKLPI